MQFIGNAGFKQDLRLRGQILDATDSVVSNIAEGFEQSSDRGFAKYLYTSKASNSEARARLLIARNRRYITDDEFHIFSRLADEIARMLTGLIKYLKKSDRRNRGLGNQTDDWD